MIAFDSTLHCLSQLRQIFFSQALYLIVISEVDTLNPSEELLEKGAVGKGLEDDDERLALVFVKFNVVVNLRHKVNPNAART